MLDTYVTIIGTVLNTPEWRKIEKNDALVATFRVASHPRRYDRHNDQWVDAPNLRIKVTCWRRLAEGVSASLIVGDPVVVYGRITSRDWTTEQGEPRLSYEVDADVVGHDLSRGQARFQRRRAASFGTVVEDAEAEGRVNGEVTRPAGAGGGAELGRSATEDPSDLDGSHPTADADALAILREAGLMGADSAGIPRGPSVSAGTSASSPSGDDEGADGDHGGESGEGGEEETTGDDGPGGPGGRGRRRGRQPVPA
jgi:single-strand DNA-binding protein